MENQLSQNAVTSRINEPEQTSDNSLTKESTAQTTSKENAGQSTDPANLILGKFKSAEDLTEAYKQLEKLQGNQSSELGMLREKVASFNNNNEMIKLFESIMSNKELIQQSAKKYPEYFSDPSFKQLYTEAYKALGADLDIDRLVNLVESYASARIFAHEKAKASDAENKKAISEMTFDKNAKTVTTPVKKSIQQMSPKELDEMLEKLI